MAQNAESKPSIDYVEEAIARKYNTAEDVISLPPLLEGFSDVELEKLGRRATWKLDLIVMPAMTMCASLIKRKTVRLARLTCRQKLHPQLSRPPEHRSCEAGRNHGRSKPHHYSVQHRG